MIAVHFGAGNIGRGFIGKLLHDSGYDVIFVDVNAEIVDEINQKKQYTVTLASKEQEQFLVTGVQAINGNDVEKVSDAIANADLITTAVGVNILPFISPAIAKGISKRIHTTSVPLNIIACENTIGGSSQLKTHVFLLLNELEKEKATNQIGFPDAIVDRIVPLQNNQYKLAVSVEPFYEWTVNQSQFVGALPQIKGITYVQDLQPYIERKLFTVNTGHATIAYLGYYKGYQTVSEAIQDGFILEKTKQVLGETGMVLQKKHHLPSKEHGEYIQKIIERFQNPYISDDLIRVGRSPIRKLSPKDRLVSPVMDSLKCGFIPEHLPTVIAAALSFHYAEDNESVEIQNYIKKHGVEDAITYYTSIEKNHPIYSVIKSEYNSFHI